jgi:hypothetical protein
MIVTGLSERGGAIPVFPAPNVRPLNGATCVAVQKLSVVITRPDDSGRDTLAMLMTTRGGHTLAKPLESDWVPSSISHRFWHAAQRETLEVLRAHDEPLYGLRCQESARILSRLSWLS